MSDKVVLLYWFGRKKHVKYEKPWILYIYKLGTSYIFTDHFRLWNENTISMANINLTLVSIPSVHPKYMLNKMFLLSQMLYVWKPVNMMNKRFCHKVLAMATSCRDLEIAVYVILRNPGCEVFALLLYSKLQMPQRYAFQHTPHALDLYEQKYDLCTLNGYFCNLVDTMPCLSKLSTYKKLFKNSSMTWEILHDILRQM